MAGLNDLSLHFLEENRGRKQQVILVALGPGGELGELLGSRPSAQQARPRQHKYGWTRVQKSISAGGLQEMYEKAIQITIAGSLLLGIILAQVFYTAHTRCERYRR